MEAEYWRRFTEGDEAIFGEIYHRYAGMLYGYGMKIVNDSMLVRECIQSLFIYIYERRKTISRPENLACYLTVSMKNMLYKEKNTSRLPGMNVSQADRREFFDLAIDTEATMEHTELQESLLDALQTALNALSPQQREVIYLRYHKSLSVDEVAAIVGISHQTVKNVTCTAIARLRQNKALTKTFLAGMLVILLIFVSAQ